MDLTQFEMLVATVDAGGIQKAAARVFRTQPAVSMALRKLEREIGAPLFDRSTRGAYTLTAQGKLLYECGKKLLRLRNEVVMEIDALKELRAGRLRIGANESAGNYWLPRPLKVFHEQHPRVKVEIVRDNSSALISLLKDDLVDFAFISFLPDDKEIDAKPMMNDPLVLITHSKHPLTKKRRVYIRDLGEERFIAHHVQTTSRTHVIEAFQQSNTPLNITMEISSLETIKRLVAMGLGIGFVPAMCIQQETERGEIARISVHDFEHQRTLWLIRRRGHSPSFASREFLKLVPSQRQNA